MKGFFIIIVLLPFLALSNTKVCVHDSIPNKGKLLLSSALTLSASSSSLILLQNVWYKDYPQTKFHFFDDGKNWMQMDKMGHGFSSYYLAKSVAAGFSKTGIDKKGYWVGAGTSFLYLGTLELMDGKSSAWGFSWYDITANATGTSIFLLEKLVFKKQYLIPKFSFTPSAYAAYRPTVLGTNFAQQVLKDYNGQTYWLSIPMGVLTPKFNKINWLCLSFGYSVDQKLVGDQDQYLQFNAERQYYLSLDVDLTSIKVKNPTLKKVLSAMNCIKVPFSALQLQSSKLSFRPIYF